MFSNFGKIWNKKNIFQTNKIYLKQRMLPGSVLNIHKKKSQQILFYLDQFILNEEYSQNNFYANMIISFMQMWYVDSIYKFDISMAYH